MLQYSAVISALSTMENLQEPEDRRPDAVKMCGRCTLRGKVSDTNELWLATMEDEYGRPIGLSVWLQDAAPRKPDAKIPRTPYIELLCRPWNGREFSREERQAAAHLVVEELESCKTNKGRPDRRGFLFNNDRLLRVCGAYGVASGESPRLEIEILMPEQSGQTVGTEALGAVVMHQTAVARLTQTLADERSNEAA